jgi:hypothetical protein
MDFSRRQAFLGLAAILAFLPLRAHAEPIGDATKCAAVAIIMDASSPDSAKAKEIALYILNTLEILDKSYGDQNKGEILPPMQITGLRNLIAMVTARCRDRQGVTIKSVAVETYERMRAAQK